MVHINRYFIVVLIIYIFFFITSVWAEERFIDNRDGTVTDTAAHLMWAKEDNMGDINWRQAEVYCKNPPIAGYRYNNWRMPTVEELKRLYDKNSSGYTTDCGLHVHIHPIFQLSCGWVWAFDNTAISAYVFNFKNGNQYSTLMMEKKYYRTLPVRTLE